MRLRTEPSATADNARGQVDFQTTPEGEAQALVTLFDSKDLSTVLHESTHIFTRQLEEIAGQGNEAAAADVRALREWAGVSPKGPLTPEEYRSFQEAVATAGEAYFMEGKAPSAKLRRVFAGFRDWLLNIYKNMRAIFSSAGFENHRLTDDVRAVFDRMLTTDDILSRSRERMDLLDGAARVNAELPLEDQAELDARLSGPVEQLVSRMVDLNKRFGEKLGGLTRADGSALHVPEKMRQAGRGWTPERIFGLALQMGNQSNMDRLHAGFPDLDMESVAVLLGDDAAARLFGVDMAPVDTPRPGLLTAADWRAIQGIWDTVNSLWPDTVDTHRKLYGFAPKKVKGLPMTLRVGDEVVELSGGYFPAKYDPRLSETAAARQEREDILRSGQAGFTAPAAKRGHTMTLANHAPGEALRLDLGQIMQHFEDATTFIALGPAVRHVDRVTRNPVWKAAYVRAFGEQEYSAIRENLKGMVGKEKSQTGGQDFAQVFRKMVTYYGHSWNLNTVMMQTDALMKSMADQGARPVLEGLGKLLRPGALDLVREIESASPYMESRSRNIDRDLAQAVTDMAKQAKQRKLVSLAGAAHTVEQIADVGLAPMRCMDMVVASALWIGAYNTKMRELNPHGKAGIDASSAHHKDAVAHADKTVKRSNPDYDATSRTKFMRHPSYSWFNMFSSAMEMIFQRQRLAFQALKAGKLNAPQYARYQLYDMILPATAFFLMGEAMSAVFGSDDDKKKRDKKSVMRRYLEAQADYTAPVLPVVGPALSSWLINGRQSQGRNVLDKPTRLFFKVGDKVSALSDSKLRGKKRQEAERALAFSILDLGGFIARIPVQRFVKYGEKVGNALED